MEKIQAQFRAGFRVLVFLLAMPLFFGISLFFFFDRDPVSRRKRFVKNSTRFARALLWIFRVRVEVKNPPKESDVFLYVGNHMGFFDVLCLASVSPSCFVTSREMQETPVLGTITDMGGCIYVERRDRTNILRELNVIADALKAGQRVTLYPEATSTNGEQVLPFKKTLIMAAGVAGVPLQPAVFNWKSIEGQPFSLKNRDWVCWYGDMGFVTAMWRHFQLKEVVAEVDFLEPIHVRADDDRTMIAEKAHAMIAAKFQPARPVDEVEGCLVPQS